MERYDSRGTRRWDDDFDDIENESTEQKQVVTDTDPTWIDGMGRRVPLKKMSTIHILNCIQLLDDKIERLREVAEKWEQEDNPAVVDQIQGWTISIRHFFHELAMRVK